VDGGLSDEKKSERGGEQESVFHSVLI